MMPRPHRFPEMSSLAALAWMDEGNEPTVKEFAKWLEVSYPTAYGVLRRLRKHKMVERFAVQNRRRGRPAYRYRRASQSDAKAA